MRLSGDAPVFLPVILGFVLVALVVAGCGSAELEDNAAADASDLAANFSEPTPDAGVALGGIEADAPDGSASLASIAAGDHIDAVAALAQLLPANARSVAAIDLAALRSGDSADDIAVLLRGDGGDPALRDVFSTIGSLVAAVDGSTEVTSALLVRSGEPGERPALLAALAGEMPDTIETADDDTVATVLADGVAAVGPVAVVEAIAAADRTTSGDAALAPFLDALMVDAHLSFVHGLPALFDDAATTIPTDDLTLDRAAVLSGALDIVDGSITGTLAFHTPNAAEFVDAYNALNRPSTAEPNAVETPVSVAAPLSADLEQVVVALPAYPLDASPDEVVASRNLFRKLIIGMDAFDYASGVADRSNDAWFEFVVRSEQDLDEPPSPGSVYIRWEFRDEAAIAEFEQNELPAGFRLAPTRFLESDDPDGEYFFALNLYNAGGGSIVGGARAEWDVYVHGPDGADPNAGVRPRFGIVDLLAEEVSADSANLLTSPEPLTHELVNGRVVSSGSRFENGIEVPVFESNFAVPIPGEAPVARFTREMAIGNDYIYWAHGVSDRVLYDASTFNHDAHFVDLADFTFSGQPRWADYLAPEIKDAVYYQNTLRYVASPMANLDSDHLDITPEWLAELRGFTTNGHQEGLMHAAVEQLFTGTGDPFVGVRHSNETPATYYHFEITDPDGLEATLDLPPGHRLAPTTLLVGDSPKHLLTLSVFRPDDALEGTRAEWSVYTDDGLGRPPQLTIIELLTENGGFDPVNIVTPARMVDHSLDDLKLRTQLQSPNIAFAASFDTGGAAVSALSLDWIEAGDDVCYVNGICDAHYYDAETLDVPVRLATIVDIEQFETPWNAFVNPTPTSVFYRTNAQQYAIKRWHNLDVIVPPLPFAGVDDPTHTISGSGTLRGRDSDIADSDYTYTGDASLRDGRLSFAIDQQVENTLGVGHIFTTGSFDLAAASGTQTVVDCTGPALLCSGIENGSTALYGPQGLDASDPDAISWQVDVTLDLGGSFGIADSASTFKASSD